MRMGPTAAFIGLVIALSACSQATERAAGETSDPSDRPSVATPTVSAPSAEPRKVLRRAVAAMTAEPVTNFEFEASLGGHPAIVVQGVADVHVGWEATIRATPPGEASSAVTEVRSVGGSTWMQMRDWPPSVSGCWLVTTGKAPLGIQALASPVEPGYISILGGLHAHDAADSSGSSLAGELDLAYALGLLQAQLFEFIEITEPQIASARVPVEIDHEKQRITRVSVSGAALLSSIEDSGGEVTSMSRSVLETSGYTVTYPVRADARDLAAPPPDRVLTDMRSSCR